MEPITLGIVISILATSLWLSLRKNGENLRQYLKQDPSLRNLYVKSPFSRTEVIKVGRYYISVDVQNRK